jgi:dihydroorotase-like cyclic amidohydrolase
MFDLIIRGGDVVTPEGIVRCDVAVAGETIAAIRHSRSPVGRVRQREVTGQSIFVCENSCNGSPHSSAACVPSTLA